MSSRRLLPFAFSLAFISATLSGKCFAGPIAYAMAEILSRVNLVSFDTANPSSLTIIGPISGATTSLTDIDFRPFNNLLYGYSFGAASFVTVNPLNAVTTFASAPNAIGIGASVGLDFNPVPDRLRLVTTTDLNLRINVDNGAAITDGTLAYAAADPNVGVNPAIRSVAYTNSDTNPATGTQLYYIDFGLDILATTTNPNAGILNTVGSLGLNSNGTLGFDILSDGKGNNTAYAILTPPTGQGLYQIDLATGAASFIGNFGPNAPTLFGLAITQLPEPGTAAIASLLTAFGLGIRSRRR